MSGRLQDKLAIVTGGVGGIGEATARLFALQGAAVMIADQSEDEPVPVVVSINATGGRAEFFRCDVTSESDWDRLTERALTSFGTLSLLVNNTGIGGKTVGDHDGLEGRQQLMETNAQSVFLGTKHAAAVMCRAGSGSIVNVSFLASDESSFVTGAELVIDGGFVVQ